MLRGPRRGLTGIVIVVAVCGPALRDARADPAPQAGYLGLRLADALGRLQSQGLAVIFSTDLVRPEMIVGSEPRSPSPPGPIDDLLQDLLTPHGLQARRGPGGIWMVVEGPRQGSIEGQVRRAGTRAPLADVKLHVGAAGTRALSDAQGRFVIRGLPYGIHTIAAEAPGFASGTVEGIKVTAGGTTRIVLELGPRHAAVEQVEVSAAGSPSPAPAAVPDFQLNGAQIEASPEVVRDVMMAVGRLPGIAAGEAAGELTIRGGADDEVLILLDGLELYDPFHVREQGGFTGIIDPRAVGGVSFIGGAFPAEYGGRMSGVIDVHSATPEQGPRYSAGIGSDGFAVSSRGGFRDTGHWLVSARRGDFSRIVDGLGIEPSYEPAYYDVFMKVDYRLSPSTRVQLNALRASDVVSGEDGEPIRTESQPGTFRSYQTSDYIWLGLDTTWTPRLLTQTLLSHGRLAYERDGSSPYVIRVSDDRQTGILGLKQTWFFESGRHQWKWGGDFKRLEASYEYRASMPGGLTRDITQDPGGQDLGIYVADLITVTPALTIQPGLRWDRQAYAETDESAWSPRINLAWRVTPRMALRAGWGYFSQPEKIHELQVQDGITDFAGTQRSQHLLVGVEQQLPAGMLLRADVYAKRMSDLRPRYENLYDSFGFFPEADFDRVRIEPDRARAHGIELGLSRRGSGMLSWSAAWTLATVADRVDARWVPRAWDQRHTLEFSLGVRPAPGWGIEVAGLYHSGRPTTPLTATQQTDPNGTITFVPVAGERNSERLPDYQRLDLRVSRDFRLADSLLRTFLGVSNALGRDNVCCVDNFSFKPLPGGSVAVDRDDRSGLPRLLSFGVEWEF